MDGRYNKLLEFLLGESNTLNEDQNLEELLRQMKKSGQYDEFFDMLAKGLLGDPWEMLNWLEEHNKDGKYNALIEKLKEFLEEKEKIKSKKHEAKFDFVKAFKGKVRQAMNQLKANKVLMENEENMKKQKLRNLFNSLLQNQKINKLKNFNALRKFNEEEK